MAFNHEYPYTDPERYNSDWLLNKIKELEQNIVGIEERILEHSKEYIDEQLSTYIQEVQAIRQELTAFEAQIESEFGVFQAQINAQQTTFESTINARVTILGNRIDELREELNNDIIGVNARTDLAIEQNNQYIFDVLAPAITENVRVRNFFTGEKISVQDMFDYLALLHVDDGITYTALVARDKTYTEFAALDMTYTNLVLHGNTLIV